VFEGIAETIDSNCGPIWPYNEDKIVHIHPSRRRLDRKGFIKNPIGDSVKKGQPLFRFVFADFWWMRQEEFVFAVSTKRPSALIKRALARDFSSQVPSDFIQTLRAKAQSVSKRCILFPPPKWCDLTTLGFRWFLTILNLGTTLMSDRGSLSWVCAERLPIKYLKRQAHRGFGRPTGWSRHDFLPGKTFASNVGLYLSNSECKKPVLFWRRFRICLDNPDQLFEARFMFAMCVLRATGTGSKTNWFRRSPDTWRRTKKPCGTGT